MKSLFISSILLAILFTGCQESVCCNAGVTLKENKVEPNGNITPIANFEELEIKKDGTNCTFSAIGLSSSDEDGDIVSYVWKVDNEEISTSINPSNIPILCKDETIDYIVCLSVTDNDNAKSLDKCKAVKITQTPPTDEPKSKSELILPTAIIGYEVIEDGNAFNFNCNASYDNDNIDTDNKPENDPKVVNCHWSVFKTKADGFVEVPHTHDGFSKWVATNNYTTLHVTLTVTDDDNQTDTVTESYELSN